MKTHLSVRKRGFSLIETVIAIGVLAVLLTGFMIVFAPAAAGIKRSISIQEADRLASTLEQELVTLRKGENSPIITTGFDKAYKWIEDSMKKSSPEVIFVYQYKGKLTDPRDDGTPTPPENGAEGIPGKGFTLVPMARRRVGLASGSDPNFEKDLNALVGRVYAVKARQLVFSGGQLIASTKEVIEDPTPGEPLLTGTTISGKYPEAVIAFSAEFYDIPSSSYAFLKTGGKFDPSKLKTPVFTRNLAVRR